MPLRLPPFTMRYAADAADAAAAAADAAAFFAFHIKSVTLLMLFTRCFRCCFSYACHVIFFYGYFFLLMAIFIFADAIFSFSLLLAFRFHGLLFTRRYFNIF